jgi:vacuolar protein sorting-associated protein 51
MRTNMDPLAPTTHTLSPAISHIAETAASLSTSMHGLQQGPMGLGIDVRVEPVQDEAESRRNNEKETVRWVLDTPRRLQALIDQDKEEEAEKEWAEVKSILVKWKRVAGVQELAQQCEEILQEEEEDDEDEDSE